MSKPPIIVHVVYIHGFQGDHTTFQAFPTDLHHALQPTIPPHVELRSILYPTYKSKRPIAVATQKFLQWLELLPTGPVILCAHSMGGLLAAEAATSSKHVSKRVIALIAYDVPFLGMHPHVVISGIASLLPHKQREKEGHGTTASGSRLRTEKEMNDDRHVNIASAAESGSPSPSVSQISLSTPDPSIPSFSSGALLAPPSLPPRPRSSSTPLTQERSSDTQSPPSHSSSLISHTLDFIESHANDRVVHLINKHRSDPITAATRWVVESLEFGICMFDPKGLKDRYAALERWDGDWIVFWTATVPRDNEGREKMPVEHNGDKDLDSSREYPETTSVGGLLETATVNNSLVTSEPLNHTDSSISSLDPTGAAQVSGPVTKSKDKAIEKQAKLDQNIHEKELKFLAKTERNHCNADLKVLKKHLDPQSSPHHFVLRPKLTERWKQVKMHGAKDEVEAHCGLFLRDINQEYDDFVRRVAEVIKGWVYKLTT